MSSRLLFVALILVVGFGAWAGCTEPELLIVQNTMLDRDCRPSRVAGNYARRGILDLAVADSYVMVPLIVPQDFDVEDNPITLTEALLEYTSEAVISITMPSNTISVSGAINSSDGIYLEVEVIRDILGLALQNDPAIEGGYSPTIVVSLQVFGVSSSESEVSTQVYEFPLKVCIGCLLDFPMEANDPLDEQPNCTASFSDNDIEVGCYPGQDEPVDCRYCRLQAMMDGETNATVYELCSPGL